MVHNLAAEQPDRDLRVVEPLEAPEVANLDQVILVMEHREAARPVAALVGILTEQIKMEEVKVTEVHQEARHLDLEQTEVENQVAERVELGEKRKRKIS